MRRVLLLDNFDSFTYNLVHSIEGLGVAVDVMRNNVSMPAWSEYDGIIISPGPGLPKDAGCMMELIELLSGKIPILGVCLGMQGIAEYLGGILYNQKTIKHGIQELVSLDDSELFDGLPSEIEVGLYHSWAVKKANGNFTITARTKDQVVMAIENQSKKLYGVQFHPESIMTPQGKQIIENFLQMS